MVEFFKNRLIDSGLVDDLLIINYEDNIENYEEIVKDIEYSEKDSQYRNIRLIKKYATYIDNDLVKNNYDPTTVPVSEYNTYIAVKKKNLKTLNEELRELFENKAKSYILISEQRWKNEIKEKQIRGIEISGERKALQQFDNESSRKISVKFSKNLKEILKMHYISVLGTKDKNINDLVCAIDSPKNAIMLAKPSIEKDIKDILKTYLKLCVKSSELFEAITFLVPEETDEIIKHEKLSQELTGIVDLKPRDSPLIKVYGIPKKDLIHILYPKETHQEKNHDDIKNNFITWLTNTQKEIRTEFDKMDRIPLDNRIFQKRDFNDLLDTYYELWEEIVSEEPNNQKINELKTKLERFGSLFKFNKVQKLSLIERDIIELFSVFAHSIDPELARIRLRRRYALSCSILEEIEILRLLTVKGILIDQAPKAKKEI